MSTTMFFECVGRDRANNKNDVPVELGWHDEQGKSFYYIRVQDTHVVLSDNDSRKLLKSIEDYKHRIV